MPPEPDDDNITDEPYSFDAAKVGVCGGGCGAEVRMFSGGQWWVDGRNPPGFRGWWCPACLKAKCDRAVEEISA